MLSSCAKSHGEHCQISRVTRCTSKLIDWLKNHVGIIENLEDPSTVRHKRVVRPEQVRLVRKIEGTDWSNEQMHHEQYPMFQNDYKFDFVALVDVFEELGNHFWKDIRELLCLNQLIFMPPDVVDNMRKVKTRLDFSYITLLTLSVT